MKDETMVAIVARETPSREWTFVEYASKISVGARSAAEIQDEQRRVFHKKRYECKILLRTDWDEGRTRAKLHVEIPKPVDWSGWSRPRFKGGTNADHLQGQR